MDRAARERSGKADYVNQNGEWFVLMRVTSIHNEAHLNDIYVKIHKNLSFLICSMLQGNIKGAQRNK